MNRRFFALALAAALLCAVPLSARAVFSDVPDHAYYADAVSWAVENRVTDGMSETEFAPDAPCTRAQIVAFLWKLSGRPEADGAVAFQDVSESDWFYPAVRWAVAEGVTNGVTPQTFEPDRVCTRAEGAAFLYKFYGGEEVCSWLPFKDVPADAWYRAALCWAYGEGVVNGVLAGRYAPFGSFTRAHIVTMLYRAEHRTADFFETAVYLGVEGYGTDAADRSNLDSFHYRFFSRGETWTCTMAPDDGVYAFQNHLEEGEAYRLHRESGVLTHLLDAEIVTLKDADLPGKQCYAVALEAGHTAAAPAAAQEGDRAAIDGDFIYRLQPQPDASVPVSGEPGLRTIRNFLANALMPVGNALYVYGGGWNWQDNAASDQTRSVALPESWNRFFQGQTADYNYKNTDPAASFYPFHGWNAYYFAGLDCSGYVGWAVYRTLNTADLGAGFVGSASAQAEDFAHRGLGSLSYDTAALRPGDVVSIGGHVWICVGRCGDGSLVILHSTPSPSRTGQKGGGAQLGAIGESESCEAYRLIERYLSAYYPAWYARYVPTLQSPGLYLAVKGVFSWNGETLSDPEGLRNMAAPEVLASLFGE